MPVWRKVKAKTGHDSLWLFFSLALVGVLGWQGAVYGVGGNSATGNGASTYVMRVDIPFGMHTVGTVILLTAAFLLYELRGGFRIRTWLILRVICGLAAGIVVTVLGSWWIVGHANPVYPGWWIFAGSCSYGLSKWPPTSSKSESINDTGRIGESGVRV